jgi:hypothetical protein
MNEYNVSDEEHLLLCNLHVLIGIDCVTEKFKKYNMI